MRVCSEIFYKTDKVYDFFYLVELMPIKEYPGKIQIITQKLIDRS